MSTATVNPGQGDPPPASSVQVFTKEQLEAAVSSARKDEKDKLYPDLQRARDSVARLETKIADLEKDLNTAKEGSTKAASLEQKITDLTTELEKQKTALTNQETTYTNMLNDALTRQATEMSQKDLKKFRESLIEAAGKEIIPELVMGTTEEELRASVVKAKERYKEIEAGGATKKETELREKYKDALPLPAEGAGGTPVATSTAAYTKKGELGNWLKMTPQEREAQLKEMKEKARLSLTA